VRTEALAAFARRLSGGVFVTAATIATLTAVARLAALAREIVVAARFGTAPEVDAFVVAFAVPSFVTAALVAAMGPAVIPSIVRADETGGAAAVRADLARLTGATLLMLVPAAGIGALAAPHYLPLFGFGGLGDGLAIRLAAVLTLIIPLQAVAALWTAALNARRLFALTALAPVLTPLVAVAALLALGDRFGMFALALGMVAGGCLELAVLGMLLARHDLLAPPVWAGRPAAVAASAGASQFAAALLLGLIPLTDQVMAAGVGVGGAAIFAYASRVTGLLAGIGTLALGQAVLPLFSRLVLTGDRAGLRRALGEALALVLLLALPAAVLMAAFSEPIISILYERGSFEQGATAAAAEVQRWYVMQVPFYLGWVVLTRLLAGLDRPYVLLALSGLAAGLNLVLNWALRPSMGVAGIGAATSLTFVAAFAVAALAVWRTLPRTSPGTKGLRWKM
jgi:putative peptidoglycan lipid II flippase